MLRLPSPPPATMARPARGHTSRLRLARTISQVRVGGPWGLGGLDSHTLAPTRTHPVSGFAKSPAWWYRSWWLGNISSDDAGRPPLANTSTFVHIVESSVQLYQRFARHPCIHECAACTNLCLSAQRQCRVPRRSRALPCLWRRHLSCRASLLRGRSPRMAWLATL